MVLRERDLSEWEDWRSLLVYHHRWLRTEIASVAEVTMAYRPEKLDLALPDSLPTGRSVLAVHQLVASLALRNTCPLEVRDTLVLGKDYDLRTWCRFVLGSSTLPGEHCVVGVGFIS